MSKTGALYGNRALFLGLYFVSPWISSVVGLTLRSVGGIDWWISIVPFVFAAIVLVAWGRDVTSEMLVGLVLILPMLVLSANAVADWGRLQSASAQYLYQKNMPPGPGHPFGTDEYGRDVISVLAVATGQAYLIGFLGTLFGSLFGLSIGLMMTSRRALVRFAGKSICEVFETVPQLLFLVLIVGVFTSWRAGNYETRIGIGSELFFFGLAIGLCYQPFVARITQSVLGEMSSHPFVKVLRAQGKSERNIAWNVLVKRYLLQRVLRSAMSMFAVALVLEAALAYIYSIGFSGLGSGNYLSLGGLLAAVRRFILFPAGHPELKWTLVPVLGTLIMSISGTFFLAESVSSYYSEDER